MPRDGSGIYTKPAGTDGVPDTTIESIKYNAFTNDVQADLNLARPIVAGGTGATSASAAMVALGGEVAQQTVTNYDTFPFVSGSFKSAPGATSAPAAGLNFYGTAIVFDINNTLLEARILTGTGVPSGPTYLREKSVGGWGAWVTVAAPNDLSSNKVSKAGDSMSGQLVAPSINAPTYYFTGTPALITNDGTSILLRSNTAVGVQNVAGTAGTLNCGALNVSGQAAAISMNSPTYYLTPTSYFITDGTNIYVRTAGALNVQNSGGSAGATISCGALTTNGNTLTVGAINAAGAIMVGNTSDAATIYFGNTGARYMQSTGAALAINGMNVTFQNDVHVSGYLHADNGNLYLAGGPGIVRAGAQTNFYTGASQVRVSYGDHTSPTTSYYNDNHNFANAAGSSVYLAMVAGAATFSGAVVATTLQINSYTHTYGQITVHSVNGFYCPDGGILIAEQGKQPGGGLWADSSDERIKNVLGDYESGLDEVIALRPVRYTFKGNDTTEAPSNSNDPAIKDESEPTVPYKNSIHFAAATAGTEYTGLIAQEVMSVMPEMVTTREAFIDGEAVTDLHDLNTTPLIFALINSTKELTTRIDALHARIKDLEGAARKR